MANTAAPSPRRRSVPTRLLRVVSPPQPRALRQVASFRYPALRQSRRHAPGRARCRPERESVQQARVLGRTADATRVGAFRFRSRRSPPNAAKRAPSYVVLGPRSSAEPQSGCNGPQLHERGESTPARTAPVLLMRSAQPQRRAAFQSDVIINSLPLSSRYIVRSRPDNVRPSDEKLPTTDDEIVTPPAHD